MKIKGVITGDIIQSTHIDPADRSLLLDTINNIVYDTEKWGNVRLDGGKANLIELYLNRYEQLISTKNL